MILPVLIICLATLAQCQKGHYIRPVVDVRLPYRMPVYQEMSFAPRSYRPLYYQNQHEQQRVRAQSRAQDSDQVDVNKQEETVAKPLPSNPETYPILSYSNEMSQDGAYSYKYETSDGVTREESSVMEMSEDGKATPKVRGSYSYPSPDGRIIRVEYVADEGGFRANQISEDSGASFRRLGSNGYSYSFRAP